MAFGGAKTYQFVATEKECELLRTVRNAERGIAFASLPKTLELSVKDQDGRFLGSCTIETRDMMKNFVSAGVGFYEELIKDAAGTREPVQPEVVYTESATQTKEISYIAPGPKRVVKDMSWEQICKAKIPACVRQVAFTIDDKVLTPDYREELQSEYPGVAILTPGLKMEEEMAQIVLEQGKPHGVREMIIELDEAEVAKNPILEKTMRDRYPWATIESGPSPSIPRKRTQQKTEPHPSSPRRPDPLEHLKDLADYAVGPDPPADEEFGYRFTIGKGWNTLTYARKLDIAHARAIQHHHGKVADGPGCSHCVDKGYQCKVYLPQLCNLSHISFGQSCQNCRLQGIQCDLPAAKRERLPTPTGPAALRLDTTNLPSFGSRETPYTPPPTTTANTPKPDLVSRMTNANDPDTGRTGKRFLTDILTFADEIQYPIHGKARMVISTMYSKLKKYLETEPFGKRFITLMLHYENLVTLYILTYLREEYDLAFLVLLRFQHTNCDKECQLPSVDSVLPPFEWLPTDAPLRRWVAILFATRWHLNQVESMEKEARDDEDNQALRRFVHEVGHVKGSSERLNIHALQQKWCEVHSHELGSAEHRDCELMEESLGEIVASAVKREDVRSSPGAGSSAASPVSGMKRRFDDDTPYRPSKWRGSTRGRGRGGRGRGRWDD